MSIIRALSDMGFEPTIPGGPGVMHGPCPACGEGVAGQGGTDRLAVWVEANTFFCRRCGFKGDFKKLFETILGLSPEAAAAKAREYTDGQAEAVEIDYKPNDIVDPEKWGRMAWNLIEGGEDDLSDDEGALEYLHVERGLSSGTIRRSRLGVVRDFAPAWRSSFGLKPSYQRADGGKVWKFRVPDGILIPRFENHRPVSITVRCWDGTYGRYRTLPGSSISPMVITGEPGVHDGAVAVVESYLCGMKLAQDTGIAVIALGGVNVPLSEDAAKAIDDAEVVLLAMDGDDAGFKAALAYEMAYANAVHSPVPGGKDVTDAWQAGLDLRTYVAAAIHRARKVLDTRCTARAVAPPAPVEPVAPNSLAHSPAIAEETPVPGAPPATDTVQPDGGDAAALGTAEPVAVPGLRPRGYRYITDPGDALEAVRRMAEANDTLGIDIETARLPEYADHPKAGLDPHLSRIRLVQIAGRRGDAVIIDAFACAATLSEILAPLFTRKLVAHNAAFEMAHLSHAGILPPGAILECTMLMWSALTNETYKMKDPSDPKSMALSLKSILRRAIGVEISKEHQKSDWGCETLTDGQLAYAANDVLHLVHLHDTLLNRLRMAKLEPVYTRMRDCQPAIVQLGGGIGFDRALHAEKVARWTAETAPLEQQVRAVMGETINLNSRPQLDAFLRSALPADRVEACLKTSTGLLSTTEEALEANADLDVVRPLLQFRKLQKLISTYGEKFASFVNPVTGRLAADFHLAGAVTGRMTSDSPGLQNMPRGDFREVFVAEPGNVIVAADFSQIEIRVAAQLTSDRSLLQAYRDGVDIHRHTAAMLLGVDEAAVTKDQRQLSKAVVFATLYGQSGPGLRAYARGLGAEMTLEEAKEFQKRLFDAYPQLRQWQEDARRAAARRAPVRTKGGRVRRFENDNRGTFTRGVNTPVQGTAGEIQLRALTLVAKELDRFEGSRIVNAVHDEIVVTCREDDADAVVAVLCDCMTQAFLEMFPGAPTNGLVECGVGRNWAEAK